MCAIIDYLLKYQKQMKEVFDGKYADKRQQAFQYSRQDKYGGS